MAWQSSGANMLQLVCEFDLYMFEYMARFLALISRCWVKKERIAFAQVIAIWHVLYLKLLNQTCLVPLPSAHSYGDSQTSVRSMDH